MPCQGWVSDWMEEALIVINCLARGDGQSDQGFHCLLIESLDATGCLNGEQRPRQFFAHVQDDLNLCILCMFEGNFLLDSAQ